MRGTYVVLPKLRVHAKPDGRLLTSHREGAIRPTDESWWRDVLHDPRARIPTDTYISADSIYAHYRLDRQAAKFVVNCPCGRHTLLERDKIIPQVGADMNVTYLARHMIDCGNRNKVTNNCRAYCVR
jgi:hypothetical protein